MSQYFLIPEPGQTCSRDTTFGHELDTCVCMHDGECVIVFTILLHQSSEDVKKRMPETLDWQYKTENMSEIPACYVLDFMFGNFV